VLNFAPMNKREFLRISSVASAGLLVTPLVSSLLGCSSSNSAGPTTFTLPPLGFSFDALVPEIDAATMEIHHGKHHAGYVRKLNAALEGHPLQGRKLEELLSGLGPDDVALRRNGGGHFNHSLFWKVLTPGSGASERRSLSPLLLERVEKSFGSMSALEAELLAAGSSRFGSGWAWLCQDAQDPDILFVCSTANQDNPLMSKMVPRTGRPILGLDVWEHAYYLNYQNRRGDYLAACLRRVNWSIVSDLMA